MMTNVKGLPKVSIVVPCFNASTYISETIESIFSQTYRNFEIILVDDGSTDDITDVISKYMDHIRFFQQENKGPSAARNLGIQESKGEYLVFLDADDILLPQKLQLQATFLDENPEIDLVYSDGVLFWASNNGNQKEVLFSEAGLVRKNLGSPAENLPVLIKGNPFPIHAAMVRKEAVLRVGGFDEDLPAVNDWDLWYRISLESNFAYLDGLVAKYRVTPNGITHSKPRQVKALHLFERKIITNKFDSFSARIRSCFFTQLGFWALKLDEPALAKEKFFTAFEIDRSNTYALAALLLTKIFNKKTNNLFNVIRNIKLKWLITKNKARKFPS